MTSMSPALVGNRSRSWWSRNGERLDLALQADGARRVFGGCPFTHGFRAADRLQHGRGPGLLVVVAGRVDGLLEGDRSIQDVPREGLDREGRQGIADQVLPVAD